MSRPRPTSSPRALAARIVRAWMTDGEYPSRALTRVGRHHGIVLEIVHGVMRWWRVLEFYRSDLVPNRPAPRVDALLLTGLYQLYFLDRTEAHAVVNDTVEIAKTDVSEGAGRLVNAVLRRALRERDRLESALEQQPLAVRCSHPDLLVSRWVERWGEADAEALCAWNNSRPDITLRIRRDRVSVEAYLGRLGEAGVEAEPHPFAPDRFVRLRSSARIPDLPGYRDGAFFVQDPAAAAAVDRLQLQPGQSVLDLCAAPGGKTLAIDEVLAGSGRLIACDAGEERLARVRENLLRVGTGEIPVIRVDATDGDAFPAALAPVAEGAFDRVLLDVPCSNTGVLRRRPDARWRFSAEALAGLNRLQRALLDAGAGRVAPGGCIVYSTCSLEPEENRRLVDAWCADHPEWRREEELDVNPLETQTDGAYTVRLRKPE